MVSLLPSITELIIALDAADRLVGRTAYDHQKALNGLPSVGAPMTPDLERLILLEPDLVIGWPDGLTRRLVGRLTGLGIRVYTPTAGAIAEIYRTTEDLGALLEVPETADSVIRAIESDLRTVRASVAACPKRNVVFLIWHQPPTVAGPGSYMDELIEIAGGHNLFRDAAGRWPTTSVEVLIDRDPDLVLMATGGRHPIDPERLLESPPWRKVLGRHLERLALLEADLFNRPGPLVSEAARRLAGILHPRITRNGARRTNDEGVRSCAS